MEVKDMTNKKLISQMMRTCPLLSFPDDYSELRAELLRRLEHGQGEQPGKPCECVCHKVGLFGLMCCPCTTRELDEFVNGKPVAAPPEQPQGDREKEGKPEPSCALIQNGEQGESDAKSGDSAGLVWKSAEERSPFASNASLEPAGLADRGEGLPTCNPEDIESVHAALGRLPWAKRFNEVTAKLSGEEMAFVAQCLWDTFCFGYHSDKPADPAQGQPATVTDHKYVSPVCDEKGCQYLFLKELRERGERHIAGWSVNSASKPHIDTMRNLMEAIFGGTGAAQPQMSARYFYETWSHENARTETYDLDSGWNKEGMVRFAEAFARSRVAAAPSLPSLGELAGAMLREEYGELFTEANGLDWASCQKMMIRFAEKVAALSSDKVSKEGING